MEVDELSLGEMTAGPSASTGKIVHADRPIGPQRPQRPRASRTEDGAQPKTSRHPRPQDSTSTSAFIKEQAKSHEPSEYAYEYVHVVQVPPLRQIGHACADAHDR